MQLEDILINEGSNIRDAIEQLERVRCRVVYVVDKGKLVASISDGDVRRFILKSGDTSQPLCEIANYNPKFFVHESKENINILFSQGDLYSIPILNLNHEVISVLFRNGKRVDRDCNLDYPVVMMAGGKGTRLYPYTKILPKALIPVGEIPIAEMIFQRFARYGCKKFFMIVNHKKNMIQAYFDGIERNYDVAYVEEAKPLGTGGGLYLLNNHVDKDFFLINCDIIIDADYSEIANFHQAQSNFITIVAAKYSHAVPYGVIQCKNDSEYDGIVEKPVDEYLINTGMYVVNQRVIELMPKEQNISFPELLEQFKRQGKKIGVYCVEESAYMDMGQLEELEKMLKKLNM